MSPEERKVTQAARAGARLFRAGAGDRRRRAGPTPGGRLRWCPECHPDPSSIRVGFPGAQRGETFPARAHGRSLGARGGHGVQDVWSGEASPTRPDRQTAHEPRVPAFTQRSRPGRAARS